MNCEKTIRRSNGKDSNIKRIVVEAIRLGGRYFARFSKGGGCNKKDDGIFFSFFLVTLGTTVRQKQLRTQLRKVHRAAL